MKLKIFLLSALVLFMTASVNTVEAADGMMKVVRVGPDGTSSSAPSGTSVTLYVGGPTPDVVKTENPTTFPDFKNGILYFTDKPDYEASMGYCYYPLGGTECEVKPEDFSSTIITYYPSKNAWIAAAPILADQVVKVVFKYGNWGSIRVERVGADGTTASAPAGTSAAVTAYGRQNPLSTAVPPTGGPMSSANPAIFPNLSQSPRASYDHTVHVTFPAPTTIYSSTGVPFSSYPYSILVGTCKYAIGSPVCDIPTGANDPESFRNNYVPGNDGGIGTIPGYLSKNVQVEQGKITRVVVKYMAPAPLSSSNQAIPVGGQTAQSIYQAQVQAAAAAPVTPVTPVNTVVPVTTSATLSANTTPVVNAPTQPAVAVNNTPVINTPVTNVATLNTTPVVNVPVQPAAMNNLSVVNAAVTTTVTPTVRSVANTPATTAANNSAPASSCTLLTYNLSFGSRDSRTGGNVTVLQDFLRSAGYLNSESSGYFGSLTFKAVKDYQRAYGISAYGYVGPITRASINPAITQACK